MFLKLTLLISVLYLCNQSVSGAADKVICYYASWAVTRPGNGKFTPEDIDPNLCTHINYAFLGLNEDGSLQVLDQENDVNQGGFKRVSDLKKINPNLKCILSIGGYAAGTGTFTAISVDPVKRAQMAKSAIEFLQTYNYDGLDIDWEYPHGGDIVNYISMLQDIKTAFEPHGYLLTVAVNSSPTEGVVYDAASMSKVLDIINVMTYDFHGPWVSATAQNSPLYGSSTESQWQRDTLNCNASIVNWIEAGADPQKLAIGIAFYGKSYILSDPSNHGLGANVAGPGNPGEYTDNVGTLGYAEICEFHPNGKVEFDDEQKVPYIYDENLWVGFDNPDSVKLKAQYAKDNNLAGVMIWSIETDDLHGFCGEKLGLLKAINEVI